MYTQMTVPSGRIFFEEDILLLNEMVACGFIKCSEKPFMLKSGIESNVYVYGREDITDNPRFEMMTGLKIAKTVQKYRMPDDKQVCLIGIPTAGTALAQAGAMASVTNEIYVNGNFICHRVMKEARKKYGVHQNWVNGEPDPQKHAYWIVDNVVTDGESKLEADKRLRESGYPVENSYNLIYVDRQQGGVARMEKAGFKHIIVVFELLDLTFAFGELGLWPKSMVKAVEEEIKAHQFIV
jgi:orotate phosphoribosyltransferase